MARNLNTDLLRAFIAVADTGGFTSAAGVLNCTQSAISMQIKKLEGLVQADLLIRSQKGLQLTPAGDELIEYARKIVLLNDEIVKSICDRRVNGILRIGLMEDYAAVVFPSLIKQFLALYPHVSIEVTTGLSYQLRAELGRKLDLVIAMEAAGVSTGELLRKERPVWAKAPAMSYDEENIPIALYPRDCVLRDIMLNSLKASHKTWRVAYHSHSISAVSAAVQEGIALAAFKQSTVPSSLETVSAAQGFVEMELVDINLHRAPRLKRTSFANVFGDFLVARMNGPGEGNKEGFSAGSSSSLRPINTVASVF